MRYTTQHINKSNGLESRVGTIYAQGQNANLKQFSAYKSLINLSITNTQNVIYSSRTITNIYTEYNEHYHRWLYRP